MGATGQPPSLLAGEGLTFGELIHRANQENGFLCPTRERRDGLIVTYTVATTTVVDIQIIAFGTRRAHMDGARHAAPGLRSDRIEEMRINS